MRAIDALGAAVGRGEPLVPAAFDADAFAARAFGADTLPTAAALGFAPFARFRAR